jgi:endoglucanase
MGAGGFSWLGGGTYAGSSPSQMEGAWVHNATISRELIDNVAAAGFNAIKIPVTWYKAMDANGSIRADWMSRVREVVDYAVANNMYIILNSHHDETEVPFRLQGGDFEETKRFYASMWTQIANEFKGYNERLAFLGLNEPRTRGTSGEWTGGTAAERERVNVLN